MKDSLRRALRLGARSRRLLMESEAMNRRRHESVISGAHGANVLVGNRSLLQFSSNDYLGFSGHPTLVQALRKGINEFGTSASASRLISGSLKAHRKAEECIAEYLGFADAMLFSSGYAANVSVLAALTDQNDAIWSDALNHASIIDGCRLARGKTAVYSHGQIPSDFSTVAKENFVVSDSVFSMDGDVVDLQQLASLPNDIILILDEAHALGVIGNGGCGVNQCSGGRADLVVGTLGKSFGLWGAFVASDPDTIALLRQRARGYVFSTAVAPALAYAIPDSIRLVRGADQQREILLGYAAQIRQAGRSAGFDVRGDSQTGIVAIVVGSEKAALLMAQTFREHGFWCHPIRPPTVAEGSSRLRITPIASHRKEDIDRLCDVIASLGASQ